MTTYRLPAPARVVTHDRVLGAVEAAFDAGEVEPRSEQEEVALVFLAGRGLAEAVADEDERPAARRRRGRG